MSGSPRKDLSGVRFGMYVALSYAGDSSWLCKCDCGTESVVATSNLTTGNSHSCGCRREHVSRDKALRHGLADSRIHRSWMSMRRRCEDHNHSAYANYGGRGIVVCARWQKFENFAADMGPMPRGYTLDRIDVNGNYEPSNCRWASYKQQARNTRTNRLLTCNGETHCVAEWAEIKGMSVKTLGTRLSRGWTIERALNHAVQ